MGWTDWLAVIAFVSSTLQWIITIIVIGMGRKERGRIKEWKKAISKPRQ